MDVVTVVLIDNVTESKFWHTVIILFSVPHLTTAEQFEILLIVNTLKIHKIQIKRNIAIIFNLIGQNLDLGVSGVSIMFKNNFP